MGHTRLTPRADWSRRRESEEIDRLIGGQPLGRISLYRWSEVHGRTWPEAKALADSGALPGYIAEGRWIALDLGVEPIELRLKLSGWHMPKKLAPDLYVNPKGMIRVRPKTGD